MIIEYLIIKNKYSINQFEKVSTTGPSVIIKKIYYIKIEFLQNFDTSMMAMLYIWLLNGTEHHQSITFKSSKISVDIISKRFLQVLMKYYQSYNQEIIVEF